MDPIRLEILMRIVLGLLLIWFSCLATDESLLFNANVRMIPKIMALDSRLSGKSTKSTLAIVYDSNQKNSAFIMAEQMNRLYNSKVSNISFNAVAISAEEAMSRKDIHFVFWFQKGNSPLTKKIAVWGMTNSIPTFSYDTNNLEYGILGSIAIERSTILYINKSTLKAGKYYFNETLFQIARFIE